MALLRAQRSWLGGPGASVLATPSIAPFGSYTPNWVYDFSRTRFQRSQAASLMGETLLDGYLFPRCNWGYRNDLGNSDDADGGTSIVSTLIDPTFSPEYAAASPFIQDPGGLRIRCGRNPAALSNGKPFIGGLLTNRGRGGQLYGFFELRAKLPPAGRGLWPAFWFLREDGVNGAEIDGFEGLGDPTIIYCTIHWNNYANQQQIVVNLGFDGSLAYHLYGVEWTSTTIKFYVDRVQVGPTMTNPSNDLRHPMYMLIDNAVGGFKSFPGPIDSATQFPADLWLDYAWSAA